MARAAFHVGRRCAAFGDDLVETAIEFRQRLGDALGRAVLAVIVLRMALARADLRLRDAFELTREIVETLVDGGKLIACSVFVVLVIPI